MIDKRVAIVLVVHIDLLVSVDFILIHRVALVPVSQLVFHPSLNITLIDRIIVTAIPFVPIGSGEIEVRPCDVSLEEIRRFETLARIGVAIAFADQTPTGGSIRGR